jgi:hypothetical protein
MYTMADGAAAEIAMVGNEGLIGVAIFMGGGTTSSQAVVRKRGICVLSFGATS